MVSTSTQQRASGAHVAAPPANGEHVAVVIPAYRVESQIERVVRGIPAWVRTIIVVVDASPDRTWERVQALAQSEPRLAPLLHETNQGVGGAMQTGFLEALARGAEVVVKMDGDDQMDPLDLPRLVEPLLARRADVSKGNRYSSLASLRQMPLVRVAGNAGLTFLVKAASGYWNVFDPANGYVALRREVLERLEIRELPKRYFFESGLLIELGIVRAVVEDVPIEAKYADEHSSLSVSRTLIDFPPRLLLGLARRLFWRYFVHDFSAVSVFLALALPLLLFGIAYGAQVWWLYNVTLSGGPARAAASAGEVMIAAMPIILGFQLLLQAVVLDVTGVPRQPLCSSTRASAT